ncbi:MAG: hypothetical protein P9M05_12545 [Candidatus Stygibacter australis]|nr:hypothetical protein [Candidatus Stygibacter australis]
MKKCIICIIVLFVTSLLAQDFSYSPYINDQSIQLNLSINEQVLETGFVEITGYIEGSPEQLAWDWGDGSPVEYGFFPNAHIYQDLQQDYLLTVTASYPQGYNGYYEYSKEKYLRFTAIQINPVPLNEDLLVYIPETSILLSSRMPGYGIPQGLEGFSDDEFSLWQRDDIEYMLSLAASLQYYYANNNIFLINDAFHQFMLKDEDFAGMYSLWYTSPVAFGVSASTLASNIGWSSFFHEMGHNITLNSPAEYYYGGKIDGCANAIFSETMAQIFQHITGYYVINESAQYGLDAGIASNITDSMEQSFQILRFNRDIYLYGNDDPNDPWFDCEPLQYESWNDPGTTWDETLYTFMTLAYEFFVVADSLQVEYRVAIKKTMELLQLFDSELQIAWGASVNSPAAEEVRATLMIAAFSYGFSADLREHFTDLAFPINDELFTQLTGRVTGGITLDFPASFVVQEDDDQYWDISGNYWSLMPESLQWQFTAENINCYIDNDSLLVQPEPDFSGYNYIIVQANSPELQFSCSDTFLVYVAAVPDPPYIVGQIPEYALNANEQVQLDLLDYFSDPDLIYGDQLSFTIDAQNAEYSQEDNILSIIPPAICYGFDQITVTATDISQNTISQSFIVNYISDEFDNFNFYDVIIGNGLQLQINIDYIIPEENQVFINGWVHGSPDSLTWDWGDDTQQTAFFPCYHTYQNLDTNYLIQVTAHYSNGFNNNQPLTSSLVVINEAFNENIGINDPFVQVTIPDHAIQFGSRMPEYGSGETLSFFEDNTFTNMTRSQIESVLTTSAYIQYDLCNNDVYAPDGSFHQVVMKDAGAMGLYSLWYLDPVCFGANDASLGVNIQWSSLCHEMGHNFTLNFPADYYYGGKIDGPANCLYSEIMAQIFQHVTIAVLLNNYEFYNIPFEIALNIQQSGEASASLLRRMYDWYCDGIYDPDTNSWLLNPLTFETWNDPFTANDETLYTFMSAAYVFMEQTELNDMGYRIPLQRMMRLLATFDQEMADSFAQNEDSPQADSFRATLMTAAISYAFDLDLRQRFRELNYPVSDIIYQQLLDRVQPYIYLPQTISLAASETITFPISEFSGNLPRQFSIIAEECEHFSIQTLADSLITITAPGNWLGSEYCTIEIMANNTIIANDQVLLIANGLGFGPDWLVVDYPDSTFIYTSATLDEITISEDAILAAFAGSECRAVQIINDSLIILIVHLAEDTSLDFQLYDNATQNTYQLNSQISVAPGEIIGSSENPYIIAFSSNLAPVINLPDSISFYEDQTYLRNILPEIYDPDNDELIVEITSTDYLLATIYNWDLSIIPAEQWNGEDSLLISVSDSQGRLVTSQLLNVCVIPVNDSPYLNCDYDFTFINDDSLTIDFSQFIYDVENDAISLQLTHNNSIIIDNNFPIITFSAAAGYSGSEEIMVHAFDGYSQPATQVIEVTALARVYGDIDLNEMIESLDAALILQYHVSLDPAPFAPLPWNDWRITLADVDGNQQIEAYDASLILQFFVGIINQFPVQQTRQTNIIHISTSPTPNPKK